MRPAPATVTRLSLRPLLVTSDADVLDDLLRLAAAVGVELEVAPDPVAAKAAWMSAPLVLVGDDCCQLVTRARGAQRRRRAAIVVVGRSLDDAGIWQRAVAVGAEHVALLPDAEPWLLDRLAATRDGTGHRGTVVAVVGGRGGAGATTLAAALATTGMKKHRRTLLIDADPLGGGADLVFGGEYAGGLRWPDLAAARGALEGQSLRDALPSIDELAVLSWDRGDHLDLSADAVAGVIEAAASSCDLVVIDVARRIDDIGETALASSDVALLVVPAEIRAAAAAARVAALVARIADDLRLVVRGPAPGGLHAADIAAALGLPIAGDLKAEPDLALALERGEAPAGRGIGPLAEFCADLLGALDQLDDPGGRDGAQSPPQVGWLPK
ncbi:MAG: septum site-determining protein Ssd [Acidothermaceae bacterium]